MANDDAVSTLSLDATLTDISAKRMAPTGQPQPAAALPDGLLGIPLTVQVVVGTARMTLSALASLGAGSIVTLEQQLSDPVTIMVNSRAVATGELFVSEGEDGRLGVRIAAVLTPHQS